MDAIGCEQVCLWGILRHLMSSCFWSDCRLPLDCHYVNHCICQCASSSFLSTFNVLTLQRWRCAERLPFFLLKTPLFIAFSPSLPTRNAALELRSWRRKAFTGIQDQLTESAVSVPLHKIPTVCWPFQGNGRKWTTSLKSPSARHSWSHPRSRGEAKLTHWAFRIL